jgi:penicillin V acylase-like amidase (Ntn superfamily)
MRRFGYWRAALGLAAIVGGADVALACSRVLWNDNGQAVVVGRNMDWPEDTRSDLWAFPRGIARTGLSDDGNSATWTSKYGSVVASAFGVATSDGMNEKGLVANLLWLTEADYGKRDPQRPGLSLSLWAQYMLDNFATVGEAVAAIERHEVQILPMHVPGSGEAATIHLSLADATGDSAIVELVDGGEARIHHGRQYTVMTNSPPFPEQLANLKKYQGFGGTQPLPGTTDQADRFVRASFYIQHMLPPHDLRETVAGVLSIMRNVAQPLTTSDDPAHPETSNTVWRTVADATDRIYFFESTLSPNIIWVSLDKLDLAAGAPTLKLGLANNPDLVGDVSDAFKPSEPLPFGKGEM